MTRILAPLACLVATGLALAPVVERANGALTQDVTTNCKQAARPA